MLKNESGLITIDFIFALVLVFSFTAILFTLSLTLSVVEVTQYVTFASSRNYFAGNVSEQEQIKIGTAKYTQLTNSPALKPLYTNGWFELKGFTIGTGEAYQQLTDPEKFTFFGASVYLRAPVLNFRVPFFGRTAKDESSVFQAQIASWLAREPSTQECTDFNQARMKLIKQIDGNTYNSPQILDGAYVTQSDNGC